MGENLINVVQLDVICEECGPEVADIFNEFVADFPNYFTQLQAAAAQADAGRVGRLAHQIKGSCSTFGMVQFTDRLRDIELQAGEGQGRLPSPETLAAAKTLFEESVRQIRAHHPRLRN